MRWMDGGAFRARRRPNKGKQMSKKSRRLKLRGFRIRYIDQRISEGASFVRAHCSCDITPALAEEMGWEVYREGHLISGIEGTKLTGSLNTLEISFAGNAARSLPMLECVATEIDDFQLARFKGGTEGVMETEVRFRLKSTAWKLMTEFFGTHGETDGQLTVILTPEQQELAEVQPEVAEDEPQMALDEAEEGSEESKPREIVNGGRKLASHRGDRRQRRQPQEVPEVEVEAVQ